MGGVAGAPEICRRWAESARFQRFILVVIVANAALMGLATDAHVSAVAGGALHAANLLVQAIFVVEIAIRLVAFFPKVHRFFLDGWNTFDFLVVSLSLLPAGGSFVTVARLARILRVARLVTVSSELRLIIATMIRSIPSVAHVTVLLTILIYVYALFGYSIFGPTDPEHWGTLPAAFRSVFESATSDAWLVRQEAVIDRHPWAPAFFWSFILLGVFVIINLFVALLINNLQAARESLRREDAPVDDRNGLLRSLRETRARLDELERRLAAQGRDDKGEG